MIPLTRLSPRFIAIRHKLGLIVAPMVLALLSACASSLPQTTIPVTEEAAQYRLHAHRYYAPPGPATDPWGPYVTEAARRFDVPEPWIRAVMQQESGGHEFINGQFVTSVPGAMGLMQLMPPTYDELRAQLSLGADPYDPHDNILAGTAYLRQMYDIYGAPGFLAAYDTGPGRLDDFLDRNRALPHETRQYVAAIGRRIAGIYPNSRSQADLMVSTHLTSGIQFAQNASPIQDPAETRSIQSAWAEKRSRSLGSDKSALFAENLTAPHVWPSAGLGPSPATEPVRSVWAARLTPATRQYASAVPASAVPASAVPGPDMRPRLVHYVTAPIRLARSERRFRLIDQAMAANAPSMRETAFSAHDWAVQVGAFGSVSQASQAAGSARRRMRTIFASPRIQIAGIQSGRGSHIYRARLTGLSREDALEACSRLMRGRSECMVVSPSSRS